MTTREKLIHPATFISLAALFVALGGVGYAATKIGTAQLKDRAVTGKKLANDSVTSAKIRRGAVANSDLATNAVTSGKIRDNSIITGKLGDGSVTSGKLADASVLTGKLGDGSVTSGKLADASVLTGKLADGSVSSGKLADASVLTGKLGDGSVTSGKLADGSVSSGKLAANSVTGTAIAPNSVSAGQIVDGQVVEGNGVLMNRETTLPNGASNTPILQFAGLGTLQGDCAAGVATIEFVNTSGTAIDVRQWGVVNGAPDTATIESSNPPNGGVIQQTTAPNGIAGITWMASFRDTVGLHLVTINVSTKNLGGASCPVSAQGLFTTG